MIFKAPGTLAGWHITHAQNNPKILAFSTDREERHKEFTGCYWRLTWQKF